MTTETANPFAFENATPPAAPAAAAPAAPAAPLAAAAPVAPAPAGGEPDPFDGPAPQTTRGPRLRELHGRLLLVIPHKVETVPNRLSQEAGATQERMTADVIVIDGGPIAFGGKPEAIPAVPHDKQANVPHKTDRMFISSVGLISQCRQALAKRLAGQPGIVLGRLAKGEAKGNQEAPWLLTAPTDADRQVARGYLATIDPFAG